MMYKLNFQTSLYIALGILFCSVCSPELRAQPALPDVDPLPVLDSLPDWQLNAQVNRLSDVARVVHDSFALRAEMATLRRAQLDQQVSAAKKDSSFLKDSLKILNKQLIKARAAEKEAMKLRKEAENTAAAFVKTMELSPVEQRKNLPKNHAALKKIAAKYAPLEQTEPPLALVTGPQSIADTLIYPQTPLTNTEPDAGQQAAKKKNSAKKSKKTDKNREVFSGNPSLPDPPAETATKTAENEIPTQQTPEKPQNPTVKAKKFKTYNPAEDVVLNPPTPPCTLTLDTKDEFSGEIRRETAREELFRYTNPVLKNYLQGKTHVVCESSVSGSATNAVLTLTLTVNDPGALKALGNLPRNSPAIFKFIDGSTYTLYTARSDDGATDATGKAFVFKAQFPLDRDGQRKFRNEQVDKIRLSWSNGYEDYDVYNIDLVKRQCSCLK